MKSLQAVMSFLLLSLAFCACATNMNARREEYETPVALLVITNDRLEDSHVYLQRHDGGRDRHIGMAHGLGTDTLVLRPSDITPGTEIGFVAMSFATGAVDQSDRITAARGVVYHWSLGPARGHASNLWRSSE